MNYLKNILAKLMKYKIVIYLITHPTIFISTAAFIFAMTLILLYPRQLVSFRINYIIEKILGTKPISVTILFPADENIRKKSIVYLEDKECDETAKDKSKKNTRIYQCFSPKTPTDKYNLKYWYDDVKILDKDVLINNYDHLVPFEKDDFPLKIKMIHPSWEEKNGILYFSGTLDYMNLLNDSESFPRDIKNMNLCSVPINVEDKKFKIKWDKLKDYYYKSCTTFMKTELITTRNNIPEQYFQKIFNFNRLNKSDYEVFGEVDFKNSILSFPQNKTGKNSSSIVLQKNIDESFDLKLDLIEFNKDNSLQLIFMQDLGNGNYKDDVLKIENSTVAFNQKTFSLEQDIIDSLPLQVNIQMIKNDSNSSNISFNMISKNQNNNKKITQSNMLFDSFSMGKSLNLKIASYSQHKTKNDLISIQNCAIKKHN